MLRKTKTWFESNINIIYKDRSSNYELSQNFKNIFVKYIDSFNIQNSIDQFLPDLIGAGQL